MSLPLARPLMRRPPIRLRLSSIRAAGRRLESSATGTTTTKTAAETAKNTAADFKSRASQGLSRVTSAAGPALAGAAKGLGNTLNALGRVGGRTGRVVAFVERQVPFVVYYSRVGLELGKLVFRGQKMSPPPLSTFQSYYNRALNALKDPSALLHSTQSLASSPASALQQVRNLSRAQLVGAGVLLAEVLGFFTVGEMIGRFKLIGYHGETESHH